MLYSNKRAISFKRIFVISLALVFVFSGCQAQEESPQPEDPEITEAVTSDLATARGIDAELLTITTNEGIVNISGTTDNLLTKERASRVASSIKGVRSVVNDVTVVSAKSEELVNEDIQVALTTDPATDEWEIETSVENGLVTLTGVVDSWQEKNLAETIVKGISGVIAVDNDLAVEYSEERADSQIREEIISALAWNNRIDAGLLDVEVNDGAVNLSGSLASLYEKNLARSIAYVAGVEDVNVSGVKIEPWLREDMKRNEFLADKSDADIEKAIKEAIQRHPRVNEDAIEVKVEDNIATLTGTATNLKAARAAAEVANHTHGVFSVENNLDVVNEIVVVPDVNLSDAEIKEDVIAALLRDPYVSSLEIDVEVNNGTVTLSGTADTYFEKYEADEVASRVNGVIQVINNVNVDYAALDYTPMYYDWDVIDYDYDYRKQDLSDEDLKEAVERELMWSPFVTAASIEVKAENGVVTLDGMVLSSYEVNQAIDEAYEAGAIKVNNSLEFL